MIQTKIKDFINAPSDAINLGDIYSLDLKNEVKLYWGDEPVGILKKGQNIFSPTVEILNSEFHIEDQKKIIFNKIRILKKYIIQLNSLFVLIL